MPLSKKERLELVFQELEKAPPATSAEEALELVCLTLEAVEDKHSGVPYDPNPPRRKSERMFRPQADSIDRRADGGLTAETFGQMIRTYPDGSIIIVDKGDGRILFEKKGVKP
jgi:hypothetical protein